MVSRRDFLRGVSVAAAAAVAPPLVAQGLPAPTKVFVRRPGLAWVKPVPSINFTQGRAARVDVTEYVTEARSLALSGVLPAGVTFDGTGFVYDGKGLAAVSKGIVLVADDGSP